MDIIIRVRRIDVAVVVSLVAHALFFAIPMKPPEMPPLAPPGPMNVVIVTPREPALPEVVTPPEPVTRPASSLPTVSRRPPPPREVPRVPQPPVDQPSPIPVPPVDMAALIEARRAQRRAAEAAAARGAPSSDGREPSKEDPGAASLARNLQSLSGREGVGGVFQVLRRGTRTGEFAFNGWRPDSQRKWREVIEVDAGQGGNVELAMVKRMIELIRTHYTGDFAWDSFRLGRVVTLSARAEDQGGLEDFMMREFFGAQAAIPRAGR